MLGRELPTAFLNPGRSLRWRFAHFIPHTSLPASQALLHQEKKIVFQRDNFLPLLSFCPNKKSQNAK